VDLAAYIDAASAMLDLEIAERHRPGMLRFLGLAAEMAAVLDGVPLDDGELALAPVFLPPAPERRDA
jgi:Protein of unknown function (DUF4089)